MINWIRRKLGQGYNAIRDALDAVTSVIATVWHLLDRVFQLIRRGWQKLAPALYWFADAVADLSHVGYLVLRTLIRTVVPKLIGVAIKLVRTWAARAIGLVRDLARGLFRTLRDWAERAINAVRALLGDVWDWTRKHVLDLLDRARRIWDKVADLVLHPERLWAWLFPHMIRPLLAFLRGASLALGRWLLETSVVAALRTAGFIESIIVKLL
jgi:hypothetical protein